APGPGWMPKYSKTSARPGAAGPLARAGVVPARVAGAARAAVGPAAEDRGGDVPGSAPGAAWTRAAVPRAAPARRAAVLLRAAAPNGAVVVARAAGSPRTRVNAAA